MFRPQGGVSVIAEPANCHNGSVDYLKTLISASKDTGADAIKFQIFEPDHLSVPEFEWYKVYQEINIPLSTWSELIFFAKSCGLKVVAELFDASFVKFCVDEGIDAFKLNIADVSNETFVSQLVTSQPKVFLSTGGSYLSEIQKAVNYLVEHGSEVVLNYGFQNYPTQLSHSHIAKMKLLGLHFRLPICFADHLAGDHPLALDLPCLAVAAGATVIEKHIVLERKPERYDYYSAIEPSQFKTMVDRIREVEICLGEIALGLGEEELKYREMHKKCPVLRVDRSVGHQLTYSDLQLKRAPGEKNFTTLEEVVGKVLTTSLKTNTPLRKEHLQ